MICERIPVTISISIKLCFQEREVRVLGIDFYWLWGYVHIGSYIFYSKFYSISGAKLTRPIKFFFSFDGGIAFAKLKAEFNLERASTSMCWNP